MSATSNIDVFARLKLAAEIPARFTLDKFRKSRAAGLILKYRVVLIGIVQACLIFCALLVAWLLRFNFYLPYRVMLYSAAPLLIALRLAAIAGCGLWKGWWRYTDLDDAIAMVKAIGLGSLGFVFCMRLILANRAFPRTIYVLEPLLSILLLGGARVFFRVLTESLRRESSAHRKVILIGAGAAAERTLQEIARPGSGCRAVACVDDNASIQGMNIHGIPVLGLVSDLPDIAARHGVREVLIAVPSADARQMLRFVSICREARLEFRLAPSLHSVFNGRNDAISATEVPSEDLLGRAPVEIDLERVRQLITGKTVLVTGAAGTIGSEICRQILGFGPQKLLCLDHNETGMFFLQMELAKKNPQTQIIHCVSDLSDAVRMRSLLAEHRPAMIIHAAAYKHVPMMESNVYDAVKNNIFALLGLLDLAEESGCSCFVLISSDKAVKPANIMGATKRVGELMVSCRPTRAMRCVSVRFGNVLGSNGSLVPILQMQLRTQQDLTITHPDVTRFFMTVGEAASLVLEAGAIGNHGDTLVLDMGSPVRILDLARKLIQLSGKSERDVEIRFTGLREGEKLSEELSYPAEEIHATASPKIWRIQGTPHRWSDLRRQLDQMRMAMYSMATAAIREKMKEIVPEFTANAEIQSGDAALPFRLPAPAPPEIALPDNLVLSENSQRSSQELICL
jgi:FlaA1/EpsC-like NDP-sugar epimerase